MNISQVFFARFVPRHYETLNLLLSFFDGDRCKLNVPDDAPWHSWWVRMGQVGGIRWLFIGLV
jgi:hypothetical protein